MQQLIAMAYLEIVNREYILAEDCVGRLDIPLFAVYHNIGIMNVEQQGHRLSGIVSYIHGHVYGTSVGATVKIPSDIGFYLIFQDLGRKVRTDGVLFAGQFRFYFDIQTAFWSCRRQQRSSFDQFVRSLQKVGSVDCDLNHIRPDLACQRHILNWSQACIESFVKRLVRFGGKAEIDPLIGS